MGFVNSSDIWLVLEHVGLVNGGVLSSVVIAGRNCVIDILMFIMLTNFELRYLQVICRLHIGFYSKCINWCELTKVGVDRDGKRICY